MHILDFNHCNLPGCKCGWNVTIAGQRDEELDDLREFLRGKCEDRTEYSKKINQEEFFSDKIKSPKR